MSHKLAKVIKYNKQSHQASKSASSNQNYGRKLGDRLLHCSSIANATTGTFASLMLILVLPLFFGVLTAPSSYAEPYALSISFVNSNNEDIANPVVEMSVSPSYAGTFSKSSTSTIGIGTTSSNGYTLSIASSDNTGDRLFLNGDNSNSSDNTKYLSSITTATTEEQFRALDSTSYNNKWGYLPSKWDGKANTDFLPAPTTTGDVLDSTTTANTVLSSTATDTCKRYNCDKYDVTIGARVDSSMQIGSYSNTYVIYATANGTPYTITYKDNTISNMPADESSNAMSGNVTISNQTPTRDGYTFIGWCTVAPTNNANGTDTCTGTTYQPSGTWSITEGATTNNLTLYAMWSGNYTIGALTASGNTLYMQDFSTMSAEKKAKVISSMITGQAYTVTDSRADKATYKIAKLKDGNIWMLDNLRLGGSTAINLTPSDTNIVKGYTLPASITSGFTGYNVAHINAAYKDTTTTSYGAGSGKIGVYYNYCAASAGTYCQATGAGEDVADTITDSPFDVCPKGWRMPTGGANGEYQALRNQYSSITATDSASFQYNLSTPLSGYFYDSTQYNLGTGGGFWSSTYYDGSRMYGLGVSSTGVNPLGDSGRGGGRSVRCILNQ